MTLRNNFYNNVNKTISGIKRDEILEALFQFSAVKKDLRKRIFISGNSTKIQENLTLTTNVVISFISPYLKFKNGIDLSKSKSFTFVTDGADQLFESPLTCNVPLIYKNRVIAIIQIATSLNTTGEEMEKLKCLNILGESFFDKKEPEIEQTKNNLFFSNIKHTGIPWTKILITEDMLCNKFFDLVYGSFSFKRIIKYLEFIFGEDMYIQITDVNSIIDILTKENLIKRVAMLHLIGKDLSVTLLHHLDGVHAALYCSDDHTIFSLDSSNSLTPSVQNVLEPMILMKYFNRKTFENILFFLY
jgi:hypothetical protein